MLAHSCSPHPCLHQPHSLIHTTSLRGPPRRHHMRNRSSSADSVHAQWGQQQQPEQANQHTEGHPSAASTPSSARSMRRLVRQLLLMLHCNKRCVAADAHPAITLSHEDTITRWRGLKLPAPGLHIHHPFMHCCVQDGPTQHAPISGRGL